MMEGIIENSFLYRYYEILKGVKSAVGSFQDEGRFQAFIPNCEVIFQIRIHFFFII